MFEPAEMRPAYEWTCDNCGRNNYVSCIVAEMSEEDRIEMNNDADGHEVELVTYPDRVTCPHCCESYNTVEREEA